MALVIKLGVDNRGLDGALGQSASKIDGWANKIGGAGALMAPASLAVGKIGKSAIQTGMEFEVSMQKVAGVTGATGKDFTTLENYAREMGKTTSKSAKEAAEAMGYMGLAGWDTTQIMTGLKPVLDLSVAGSMDLATASDLVTDSLSAMKLDVAELPGFLDKVAKAQTSTNTTAEQLMEAFLKVGSTTANLKMPLAESSAALGILANNGLKGSLAGTKLNRVLQSMTAQTDVQAKGFKMMGVEVYDSNGKFKGLTTVLEQCSKGLAGMSQEQQMMALKLAVGKDNVVAFKNLVDAAANGSLPNLTKELENSDGALADLTATMEDTTKNKLQLMKSALDDAAIETFKVLAPIITDVANKIADLARAFTELNPNTQKLIVYSGAIVALSAPVLGLTSYILKLGGAFLKLPALIGGAGAKLLSFGKAAAGMGAASTAASAAVNGVGAASTAASVATGVLGKATSKGKVITDKALATQLRHAKSMQTAANNATKMAAAGKISGDAAQVMANKASQAALKTNLMAKHMGKTLGAGVQMAAGATTASTAATAAGTAAAASGGIFSSLGGIVAGVGAKFGAFATFMTGPVGLALAGTAVAVGGVALACKTLSQDAIPEVDLFADSMQVNADGITASNVQISDSTKKILGGYMEMAEGAQLHMLQLYTNGTVITDAIVNDTTSKYQGMADVVIGEVKRKETESLKILHESGLAKAGLTSNEITEIENLHKDHAASQITRQQQYVDQIKGILDKAKNEKRELTIDEKNQINQIESQMKENSIRNLTASEAEQAIIMQRLTDYNKRLTAEQAAAVVKSLNEQRDKSVAAAESQYDKQIVLAEETKRIGGKSAEDAAQKIIKAAERQRDQVITSAEFQRKQGLDKLAEGYGDLKKDVDTNTGEIKTFWDKLKEKFKTLGGKQTMTVETKYVTTGQPPNTPGGKSIGRSIPGVSRAINDVNSRTIQVPVYDSVTPASLSSRMTFTRGDNTPTTVNKQETRSIIVQNMTVRKESDIADIARKLNEYDVQMDMNIGRIKYFKN